MNSTDDFEKDLRDSLKEDISNFDTEQNFKSIVEKINRNKDVPKIDPKRNKFQLNYWLVAAAMSAIIIGFGIERQLSNYSIDPSKVYMQDSILDSSSVDVDSILLNWK